MQTRPTTSRMQSSYWVNYKPLVYDTLCCRGEGGRGRRAQQSLRTCHGQIEDHRHVETTMWVRIEAYLPHTSTRPRRMQGLTALSTPSNLRLR